MSAHADLITQAEFGRRHRLSRTRMKRLVAEGLPVTDGKVPVKRATKWLRENVDASRKDHWNGDGASLNELRRQREAIKIDAGRLELAKASGAVIERSVVRKFLTERANMERSAWLSWASAASTRLAASLCVDTGKVFGLLEAEVRDHLRQLASKALKDSKNGSGSGLA
jgi:hypothetical protein